MGRCENMRSSVWDGVEIRAHQPLVGIFLTTEGCKSFGLTTQYVVRNVRLLLMIAVDQVQIVNIRLLISDPERLREN